jgi:hypothetical protein
MQIRAFCTTGDIHNNNLQFNDSIKYYMQGILIFKQMFLNCFDMTACAALSLFGRRT